MARIQKDGVDHQPESVKKALTDYASSATAHGIGHMVGARNWVFKILWLLLFLGAIGMVVYQVALLYCRYTSYPYNTKVELINRPLQFPSVTLCNHNPVRFKAVLENQSIKTFLKSLDNYFQRTWITNEDEDTNNFNFFDDNGTSNDNNSDTTYYYDYYYEDDDGDDDFKGYDPLFRAEAQFKLKLAKLEDLELGRYMQHIESFIIKCTYGGRTCSHEDFKMTRDYDYGVCFTFPNKDKHPDGIISTIAGPLHGLHLILNIQQSDYVPYVSPSAGVRVNIHGFGTVAFPYESGFSVEPGKESFVSVKMEQIKRLKEPHGKCDTSELFPSFLACMRSCLELLISLRCGCSRTHKLSEEHAPICKTEKEIECIDEEIQAMQNGTVECESCNKPCQEKVYRHSISTATWPSDKYERVLSEEIMFNIEGVAGYESFMSFLNTPQASRHNLLKLNIYYGELYYEQITEEPAYEIENFISDIGGQLGLWAGISILSLAECVELLSIIVEIVFRRFCRGKKVNDRAVNKDRLPTVTANGGW